MPSQGAAKVGTAGKGPWVTRMDASGEEEAHACGPQEPGRRDVGPEQAVKQRVSHPPVRRQANLPGRTEAFQRRLLSRMSGHTTPLTLLRSFIEVAARLCQQLLACSAGRPAA